MAGDQPVFRALLHVDHPDATMRLRGRNALVVIYPLVALGVIAVAPLAMIPHGQQIAAIVALATLGFVASAALVRAGRVGLGLALFFTMFLGAFVAVPLIAQDARLSAVYCAMPVGIAGVTLGRRGVAVVTAAALTIAVVGTYAYPPVDPPPTTREIVLSAVFLIVVALTTSLLGLRGQREETRRADAETRRATELAHHLQRVNADLEVRVEQRTEELQLALAGQESLVAELAELALRDPLTGLYNRRHADHELPRLVASAQRHDQPLSMAMADLDHFKRVNDDHSYSIGDEVLRRFARIIQETARGADVITRYGGEEFLLVMPQTALEQANIVCERLRREVERHPWHEVSPGLRVTVSIGVADTVKHDGLLTLVAASDTALHDAKRAGRNRVVPADGRNAGVNGAARPGPGS
jgi:diguanylate cyclase (GGDEF)-like protein